MKIAKGYGFNIGHDFARAPNDMEIELAPSEYAKPGYVIGYIKPLVGSCLPVLDRKVDKLRVHVLKEALID